MIGKLKRFVCVCLVVSPFAAKICGAPALPPGPGYERVKLYLGPLNSDQWEWGWAPKALPDSSEWSHWGSIPDSAVVVAVATDEHYQYVLARAGAGRSQLYLYRNGFADTNWTSLGSAPACEGPAAIIGDTLYFRVGYSYGSGGLLNRLYKYSIAQGDWTYQTGPCPYAWDPSMVAMGGKLYLVGGCDSPGADNPSKELWVYTPGASVPWVRKDSCHTGRVFAQLAAHDGKLWLAGGTFSDGNGITDCEWYDPATDVWSDVNSPEFPNLPQPTWAGGAACVGNKAFIYCGASNGYVSNRVKEFDFASRTWDTVPADPSHAVYRVCGVASPSGLGLALGGTTGGYVPVEFVSVKQFPIAHDVGVTRIDSPASDVDSGDTVTPSAWVKNLGEQPEGSRVMFRIDDSYTRYDSVGLQPGESTQVSFEPWVAVQHGVHLATCSTMLAGDENPANDARLKSFTVTIFDLQLISWLLPHMIDSGMTVIPLGIVYNNGTSPVGLWTILHIDSSYSDRESTYILPGSNVNITLGAWTAVQRGWHTIACTLVAGHHVRVYYDSIFVRVKDAGVDRVLWPVGDRVSEGMNIPRALVHNYGNTSETIPARFEIFDSSGSMVFSDSDDIMLGPGASGRLTFGAVFLRRALYRSFVFSSLSGDRYPANDTTSVVFRIDTVPADIVVTAVNVPDTMAPGPVSPSLDVFNNGLKDVHLHGSLDVLKDETLLVFSDSQATLLPVGANKHVVFGPWQASAGQYVLKFVLFSDSESVYETLEAYMTVLGEGVEEPNSAALLPKVFALDAPSPNPCRGAATICYALPHSASVSLKLYDASGRLAAILDQGWEAAGRHTAAICDPQSTIRNASGVYFVRLEAAEHLLTRKLVVSKE